MSPASKSKIEYVRGELSIVSPSSLIATGVVSEEGHESPAESRPFQVLFSESLLKTCSVQKAKGRIKKMCLERQETNLLVGLNVPKSADAGSA